MYYSAGLLINELGGCAAVADIFGIDTSEVCRWSENDCIPTGWHVRIVCLCHERGISPPPELFNLPDELAEAYANHLA